MENNEVKQDSNASNGQKQIAGAILLAGILIAGAVLLRGNAPTKVATQQGMQQVQDQLDATNPANVELDPVTVDDHVLGNAGASVTLIEYADFQCPFCGKFYTEVQKPVEKDYVSTGKIKFVYRDYAFLGEESTRSAEAAKCADDQGKFWEYHDYLFTHQSGENRGAFADANLKTFAKVLGLNTATFNTCLDSNKYADEVELSTSNGTKAGVRGTPKGFIVKNGKIVATIDGAEPYAMVKAKIDKALK